MDKTKQFLNCKDVMVITGMSQTKAYSVIKQLNARLKAEGCMTIKGRIPKTYFYKVMGLEEGGDPHD